ncbi:hypothetical protein LIER_13210 [Lithospermum erythrorhizon]|uniref:Uncharacterized protein n=1 Tax=Lithospermum erythrorhizon TaxID=34254 RepID=A0AAV3PXX0_LITER
MIRSNSFDNVKDGAFYNTYFIKGNTCLGVHCHKDAKLCIGIRPGERPTWIIYYHANKISREFIIGTELIDQINGNSYTSSSFAVYLLEAIFSGLAIVGQKSHHRLYFITDGFFSEGMIQAFQSDYE